MKTLLTILCILAFCISAQAQYGRCFSAYNLYDEYLWTFSATQYKDPLEAQTAWTVSSSAAPGYIYRLGFNDVRGCEGFMVTDVRLVAVDGKLICVSDVAYGCNGY